ncbi:MAG: protein kinase [Actinobacteria bacterium]|nr:protein kinase [Actinomycetota bacterium]
MPSVTSIADRYELISELGRGGMGVVWRAKDARLGREIALKEVKLPHGMAQADRDVLRQRVLREAKTAASLGHPGAVTVFDVIDEDDRIYIAMELLDAPSLADLVTRDGPLTHEQTALIARDLLAVLEAAHRQGIVHRDVKPANVMVMGDGRAKLADFGIAAVTDDPKLTASGYILGTPAYMAPEQAEGKRSQPATDLWGLGVTLYFALVGRSPFGKSQPIATLRSVIGDEVEPPEGPLASVIADLLSKDPSDRPEPAVLRPRLVLTEPTPAPTPAPVPEPAPVPAPVPAPSPVSPVRRARPSGRVLAAGGLAATAVLVVAGFLLLGGERDPGTNDPDRVAQEEPQDAAPSIPEGWKRSKALPTGYKIAYPEGWEVVENSIGDDSSVDFRDPGSGAYMRVDWTDTPGTDVVGTAESFEAGFADRHGNYDRVKLEPATFKGFEAVDWEYTFVDGGVQLHAVNLQFVTGPHGFALNFQTRADDWDALQEELEIFKETFEAPS